MDTKAVAAPAATEDAGAIFRKKALVQLSQRLQDEISNVRVAMRPTPNEADIALSLGLMTTTVEQIRVLVGA